jgi:polyisoprenoid-binding protein YceI
MNTLRGTLLAFAFAFALLINAQATPENAPPSDSSEPAPDPAAAMNEPPAAGVYHLDKSHASLLFRVNHIGFSNYTARFKHFDAELHFDPQNVSAAQVTATVDARSIETDFPTPEKLDFNAQLQGEQWLNTAQFPQMTFRSTKVRSNGAGELRVEGDVTIRGVTKPFVFDVTYNGGYAGMPQLDPQSRIGISARGTLKRSDFGMSFGLPPPGTKFGVGDEVELILEAEFLGPPLARENAR